MAPFRIRHPKGVSTLQLDVESATVQDLLQGIFTVSDIPLSTQDRAPLTASLALLVSHSYMSQLKQDTHHGISQLSSPSSRSPVSA